MTSSKLAMVFAAIALIGIAAPARAIDPVNTNWRGWAVRGYDPVAYFVDGHATEGKSEFTTSWQGATWRFASAEHRDRFVADPEAYAPQYGGYCAYAVARGETANIDPEAWRIVSGKLYLNYDKEIQAKWERDVPGFIARADQNWPRLVAGR